MIDTEIKTRIHAAKTASKRVVQTTGDLTGNKIANKITSGGKSKEDDKTRKVEEIYIPLKKIQQIIDDLKLF